MRSKKDRDTVVIVIGKSEEVHKVLNENSRLWEEVKKPELDGLLEGIPAPNRAERRRQRFGIYGVGPQEGDHPADCKCRICFCAWL